MLTGTSSTWTPPEGSNSSRKFVQPTRTRFESVGTLVSNSTQGQGFVVIRTTEHGDIQIYLDADQIVEEFDGSLRRDLQFDLQVELDKAGQLKRVVAVYDIGVIDAQIGAQLVKCKTRLSEIGSLGAGWHDGTGELIGPKAIAAAERFLLKRPSLCARYKIYPTEGGGVLFEFDHEGWDFSVEFGPDHDEILFRQIHPKFIEDGQPRAIASSIRAG